MLASQAFFDKSHKARVQLLLTMNKFIEKGMTIVSVLHFFTRVNSKYSRFNGNCV